MWEPQKIDMVKLCNNDKNYYDNLMTPRFEAFFTYGEGEGDGYIYPLDEVKDMLENEDTNILKEWLKKKTDDTREILKITSAPKFDDNYEIKVSQMYDELNGTFLFGYMLEDVQAIASFNENQRRAFDTTCKNYYHMIEKQGEEIHMIRKKLVESMELMLKMDKRMEEVNEQAEHNGELAVSLEEEREEYKKMREEDIFDLYTDEHKTEMRNAIEKELGNPYHETMDFLINYFKSEIDLRIIDEKEIKFNTKNVFLVDAIKEAVNRSEYNVKMKCMCEKHTNVWVELSDD